MPTVTTTVPTEASKIRKVIRSCKTIDHLYTASSMVLNYAKQHGHTKKWQELHQYLCDRVEEVDADQPHFATDEEKAAFGQQLCM